MNCGDALTSSPDLGAAIACYPAPMTSAHGTTAPAYERWVADCLAPETERTELAIGNVELARYMERLFHTSGELPKTWSYRALNRGIWYVGGTQSEYSLRVCKGVPLKQQQLTIAAVKTLYADLFKPSCPDHFGHLDAGPEPPNPLSSACYMLWDMDGGIGTLAARGNATVRDAAYDVLRHALDLDSLACNESALHGLGHLHHVHGKRATRLVDGFLARRGKAIPVELRRYAEAARIGRVQ